MKLEMGFCLVSIKLSETILKFDVAHLNKNLSDNSNC